MMAERSDFLETLLKGYAPYFDIERTGDDALTLPLAAKCTLHVHSEKYFLMKKAVLWNADSHEYVFLFSMPQLSLPLYQACLGYAYEEGMALIHPGNGHMVTYLTAVFLCDLCDPDARKALRRCRLHKNFRFALDGWMDFHTALIELQSGKVCTNSSGHENAGFLKKLLHYSAF